MPQSFNIVRSLSYRSGLAFRRWQTRRYQRLVENLPIAALSSKPPLPFRLLLFCGQKHLPLARQCVLSLYHAWSAIPVLKLVSDGSVSSEALLEATSFWPGDRSAEQWTAPAQRQSAKGRPDLLAFAEKNTLGRKLAAILDAADDGALMYCDSDILWFAGPPPLPERAAGQAAAIRMAADIQRCYDENLIAAARLSQLEQPPWLNSGVVYVEGEVSRAVSLDRILPIISQTPGYFSEQTTLAYIARTLGSEPWRQDQIALCVDDQYWPLDSRFRQRRWLARHYVGNVRHWFWRDALALHRERCGSTGPVEHR